MLALTSFTTKNKKTCLAIVWKSPGPKTPVVHDTFTPIQGKYRTVINFSCEPCKIQRIDGLQLYRNRNRKQTKSRLGFFRLLRRGSSSFLFPLTFLEAFMGPDSRDLFQLETIWSSQFYEQWNKSKYLKRFGHSHNMENKKTLAPQSQIQRMWKDHMGQSSFREQRNLTPNIKFHCWAWPVKGLKELVLPEQRGAETHLSSNQRRKATCWLPSGKLT